ncbi:hypothetical protein [Shewanella psychrophila]|uniref:hypothetical protein n=1 Tax=Shewanella psychrophila TaxID=225848 RepID=UPI001475753D|nr:hypothetical protein [Shewanella psychrophila]
MSYKFRHRVTYKTSIEERKQPSVDTAASCGSMDAAAEITGTVLAASRRSICIKARCKR